MTQFCDVRRRGDVPWSEVNPLPFNKLIIVFIHQLYGRCLSPRRDTVHSQETEESPIFCSIALLLQVQNATREVSLDRPGPLLKESWADEKRRVSSSGRSTQSLGPASTSSMCSTQSPRSQRCVYRAAGACLPFYARGRSVSPTATLQTQQLESCLFLMTLAAGMKLV